MQQLVILGATGTIGRNTLDVARRHPQRLQIFGLSAHRNVEAMLALCAEFSPRVAVMADEAAATALRLRLRDAGLDVEVFGGAAALAELAAAAEVDQVMAAIVGAAGLVSTLAAVQAGKRVLIANKEPLVMAGRLLMQTAARSGATLIPIDSEHNAIFQCLPAGSCCGSAPKGVRRVILTASGGPFLRTPMAALASVTPAQAVRHPNWVMGPKISVDSATMMNKGLEIIEASVLYDLAPTQIEAVIHPQSTVHSLVEYIDGSLLAQLGHSDMRIPIAHALAWPERWASGVEGLDMAQLGSLQFEAPDEQRFACLRLARQALETQGAAPNVLNAANEVAVEAFLQGRLGYTGIATVIETTLNAAQRANLQQTLDLDSILDVDRWARARAQEVLHA
nr:1-deoxy-D-xylulose-5-phosphate reductoisomerase [Sinimarinibacterium sp. NLF-5-8]